MGQILMETAARQIRVRRRRGRIVLVAFLASNFLQGVQPKTAASAAVIAENVTKLAPKSEGVVVGDIAIKPESIFQRQNLLGLADGDLAVKAANQSSPGRLLSWAEELFYRQWVFRAVLALFREFWRQNQVLAYLSDDCRSFSVIFESVIQAHAAIKSIAILFRRVGVLGGSADRIRGVLLHHNKNAPSLRVYERLGVDLGCISGLLGISRLKKMNNNSAPTNTSSLSRREREHE